MDMALTHLVILDNAREHELLHAERYGYELVRLPPCEPGDLNLAKQKVERRQKHSGWLELKNKQTKAWHTTASTNLFMYSPHKGLIYMFIPSDGG